MKHCIRFFLPVLAGFLLSLVVPQAVYAMDFRTSDKAVVVAESEMIDGTLFATGNTIEIIGAVEGDLICAGQTILITGSVGGDVICAGQTIRIDGTVAGNVRTIGQTVDITGSADRNSTVFGQTIALGKEGVISGDAVFAGQSVSIFGEIGKGMLGAGNDIRIDGAVDEDARLIGNVIQIGDEGNITGTLTYESQSDARISSGSSIGRVVKEPLRKEFKESKEFARSEKQERVKPWPVKAASSILFHIVVGALTILLFKTKAMRVVDMMKNHPGPSFGYGLLWIVLFPILFIMVLVTIIGIPFAMLYAVLFGLVFLASKVFVALVIGREVVQSFWKSKELNWYIIVVCGVILTDLSFHMPFVGGFLSFLSVLWGSGGLVYTFIHRHRFSGKKLK